MCILFYFHVVRLHVCAYAFKFKVHCGNALGPGASGLPYYCTPPVTVPDVIGDSWSLSHLGYLYQGTTPVMIKLD